MPEYQYKKLGSLAEGDVKVNIFGVISSIIKLHKPTTSGRLYSQIQIVDDTCREEFVVHIFYTKEDDLPGELQVFKIIRVHRMKVEKYWNKLDGRIFQGQDIVVFESDENSNVFYSTAKVSTITGNDMSRVNQLKKWMKECNFTSTFQINRSKLCDIREEKVFNLLCKLTNVRMFPDWETVLLTVKDGTKCPELLYKVPANWSSSELPEDFHRDMSEVDIIFYEGRDYYETIKPGDFCQLWCVKSVKCNTSVENSTYKLIMLKDESSIFTIPHGAGRTFVLDRRLERGTNEGFSSNSEVELSLQNKKETFDMSSQEESEHGIEQQDNLRNNIFAYQIHCNNKFAASNIKPKTSQIQSPKSEVKSSAENRDISALSTSAKSHSIDHEHLFKHASTSKHCEIQLPENDLSGSDTDIEVLSLHSETGIEKFKCDEKDSKASNLCSKSVDTKHKQVDEMKMRSNEDTHPNKRNSQTVTEMQLSEDDLPGSDIDIDVLSSHSETDTEEFKCYVKRLSSFNNSKASSLCSKNVTTEHKPVDEMSKRYNENTSPNKTNNQRVIEIQILDDFSGSDTDIEEISYNKADAISSYKEHPHCLPSSTEEFKCDQKGLSSFNLKATREPLSQCGKCIGPKRKQADEVSSTSNGNTSPKKRNNQIVTSQTNSKSELVIDFKTLEMWRNSLPTLFNTERIELATNKRIEKDVDNSKSDIFQRINVFLVDVRPSLDDDAMDMVSGYCHSGCYEMFLHSTLLRDNRNNKHLCPVCSKQGLKRDVQLMLLVELIVMNTSGVYMNVVVCSKQAEKFFGCSVEQYMSDVELRSSIIKALRLHSVYKNIKMDCEQVPIMNLLVMFQENKYFIINSNLKIK